MDKAIESRLFPFHFLCHSTVTVALHKETSKKVQVVLYCCIKTVLVHLLCGLIYPVYHFNSVGHFSPVYKRLLVMQGTGAFFPI